MLFLNENYVAEYVGKKYGNFIKGHFYRIKIEDNIPYGVMLVVSYDETEEDTFNTSCQYSNFKSIERSWKISGND